MDLNDLISELKVLQLTLPDRQLSAMDIFEIVKEVDNYPNVSIAYRIIFSMPVTFSISLKELLKVKVIEKLFDTSNV